MIYSRTEAKKEAMDPEGLLFDPCDCIPRTELSWPIFFICAKIVDTNMLSINVKRVVGASSGAFSSHRWATGPVVVSLVIIIFIRLLAVSSGIFLDRC